MWITPLIAVGLTMFSLVLADSIDTNVEVVKTRIDLIPEMAEGTM